MSATSAAIRFPLALPELTYPGELAIAAPIATVAAAAHAPVAPVAPDDVPQWFAIWTRSRHEKKVSQQLHEEGLQSFLPLCVEVHRWSDRRKIVDMPLFPGYTFLHAPYRAEVRSALRRIPGAVGFVGWRGIPIAIPDREIESVQALLAQRVALLPHEFLRTGSRVRIRGGALDGLEGILAPRNSQRCMVVSVELIQRSVALAVDGYDLEPA
jgi:transcription antitermination factor NusG